MKSKGCEACEHEDFSGHLVDFLSRSADIAKPLKAMMPPSISLALSPGLSPCIVSVGLQQLRVNSPTRFTYRVVLAAQMEV